MFKAPLYNLNYDWAILNQPRNLHTKKMANEMCKFLKHDFFVDFNDISRLEAQNFSRMKEYLSSKENQHSRLVYHMINFHQLNPRRSNKEEENSLLHFLCAFGRLEDVKWLLTNYPKIKVNLNNHIFQTPLQFAIAIGESPEIAEYLISKGANVCSAPDDIDDPYTISDALFLCWVKSDTIQVFYQKWSDILTNDEVLNDIEEKYPNFFEDIWLHQLEEISHKRIKI